MRQPAWISRQSQRSLSQPQFLHLQVNSSSALTGLEETLIKLASLMVSCCATMAQAAVFARLSILVPCGVESPWAQ